jgi:L-ascorbate metabolism protein UlaG (beta-lactamase superfamily)
VAQAFAGLVVLAFVGVWFSTDRFRGFGAAPDDAELGRMKASPHFVGGQFVNDEPTDLMKPGQWAATKQWFFGDEMRSPPCTLPIVTGSAVRIATPAPSGLRITWLGHSTTLLEIDGRVLLTDPQWSELASPSRWAGPKRFHPPPIPLDELPKIDAVLISHEHFDHLDMATVRALAAKGIPFHAPLGVGVHLRRWGIAPAQIVEHDWWERSALGGGVEVVSTPARHFNGRGIPWRTGTFWTSWSIIGPSHRVFFSGDTGQTKAFREIGRREGPFDVAMLEIGQWHPSWGDIHLGPRGATEAFERLGAKRLVPIHWATFQLAMHAWSEPAETLVAIAAERGTHVLTPRLGEPIEPTLDPPTAAWWRALPPIAERCP